MSVKLLTVSWGTSIWFLAHGKILLFITSGLTQEFLSFYIVSTFNRIRHGTKLTTDLSLLTSSRMLRTLSTHPIYSTYMVWCLNRGEMLPSKEDPQAEGWLMKPGQKWENESNNISVNETREWK